MKKKLFVCILVCLSSSHAMAARYGYHCTSRDEPMVKNITVDTNSSEPVLVGTYRPEDSSLPVVTFYLVYEADLDLGGIRLPQVRGKMALLTKIGKSVSAHYANIGEPLVLEYSSGVTTGKDGLGGSPFTSAYDVVCEPVGVNRSSK